MSHIEYADLLAYWLGELQPGPEAQVEEHYFGCVECTQRLHEIEALAEGVRRAFGAGLVAAVVTPAFVEQVKAAGVRVREYRLAWNGSVNCTVLPADQVLFGRLAAPLEGVKRLDAIVSAGGDHRLEDIPFDAASGEVVMAPSVALLRTLPDHRQGVKLVSVEEGGERVIGEYAFHHRA